MEYEDHVAILATSHPEIAREIGAFIGLERVLNWLKARGHSLAGLDLITQDEFCHDLLIPLGTGEHLVFGMS